MCQISQAERDQSIFHLIAYRNLPVQERMFLEVPSCQGIEASGVGGQFEIDRVVRSLNGDRNRFFDITIRNLH